MASLGQLSAVATLDVTRFMSGLRQIQSGISSAFNQGAKAVFTYMQSLETAQLKFSAFFQDTAQAARFTDVLQDISAGTAFNFEDLEKGAGQLAGMGIKAENLAYALGAIANQAAVLNDRTIFERLGRSFGQVLARGNVTGDNLRQIAEAGVQVNDILAELGTTWDEASKSGVTATEFINATIEHINKMAARVQEAILRTMKGAFENMLENMKQIAAVSFIPLYDQLRTITYEASKAVQEFNAFAQIHGLGNAMLAYFPRGLYENLNNIATVLRDILYTFMSIATNMVSPLQIIGKTLLAITGWLARFGAATTMVVSVLTKFYIVAKIASLLHGLYLAGQKIVLQYQAMIQKVTSLVAAKKAKNATEQQESVTLNTIARLMEQLNYMVSRLVGALYTLTRAYAQVNNVTNANAIGTRMYTAANRALAESLNHVTVASAGAAATAPKLATALGKVGTIALGVAGAIMTAVMAVQALGDYAAQKFTKAMSAARKGAINTNDILSQFNSTQRSGGADLSEFNNQLSGYTDRMKDAGDEAKAAGKKAKEAAKGLLAFDEVFKLNEPDETTGGGAPVIEMPDLNMPSIGGADDWEFPDFEEIGWDFGEEFSLGFVDACKLIWYAIKEAVPEFIQNLGLVVVNFLDWLVTIIATPFVWLAEKLNLGLRNIGAFFTAAKDALGNNLNFIGEVISSFIKAVSNMFQSIWDFLVTLIQGLGEYISTFNTQASKNISAVWNGIGRIMYVAIEGALNAIKLLFQGDFTGAKQAFLGIGTNVKQAFNDIGTEISKNNTDAKNAYGQTSRDIKDAWSNMTSTISSGFSTMSDEVTAAEERRASASLAIWDNYKREKERINTEREDAIAAADQKRDEDLAKLNANKLLSLQQINKEKARIEQEYQDELARINEGTGTKLSDLWDNYEQRRSERAQKTSENLYETYANILGYNQELHGKQELADLVYEEGRRKRSDEWEFEEEDIYKVIAWHYAQMMEERDRLVAEGAEYYKVTEEDAINYVREQYAEDYANRTTEVAGYSEFHHGTLEKIKQAEEENIKTQQKNREEISKNQETATGAFNAVGSASKAVVDGAASVVGTYSKTVKTAKDDQNDLTASNDKAMTQMTKQTKAATADMSQSFTDLTNDVSDAFEGIDDKMTVNVDGMYTSLQRVFDKIVQAANKTASLVVTQFTNMGQRVSSAVNNTASSAANNMSNQFMTACNKISTSFNTMCTTIVTKLQQINSTGQSTANTLYNSLAASANMVLQVFTNVFSQLPSLVNNASWHAANAMYSQFASHIQGIMSMLSSMHSVLASVSNYASALRGNFDQLTASVNRSILAVNNLISSYARLSGTTTTRRYATGGIVTREQVAIVGEGNRNEAIIPLQNAGAMQPFVDAVAGSLSAGLNDFVGTLLSNTNTVDSSSDDNRRPLYVGTLIASKDGLRQLEREMRIIQVENGRRGIA